MPILTSSISKCVLLSLRAMDMFYASVENFEFSYMPVSLVDVLFWVGLVVGLHSFRGLCSFRYMFYLPTWISWWFLSTHYYCSFFFEMAVSTSSFNCLIWFFLSGLAEARVLKWVFSCPTWVFWCPCTMLITHTLAVIFGQLELFLVGLQNLGDLPCGDLPSLLNLIFCGLQNFE